MDRRELEETELLRVRLGVTDFYCHTHASGLVMKRMGGRGPPRSLSTRLPQSFSFRRTREAPSFIQASADGRLRHRLRHKRVEWFQLAPPARRRLPVS